MSKYIDAEKLIAEIEFAKSVYDNPKRVVHGIADAFRQDGRAAMCDDILKKLDALQQEQPEVELEKEIEESEQSWYNEAAKYWAEHCELNKTKDQRILILDAPTFTELVHDFYELGRARKEE